jgi:hypothetical protein
MAAEILLVACNDKSGNETTGMLTQNSSTFDISKARADTDADNAKFWSFSIYNYFVNPNRVFYIF